MIDFKYKYIVATNQEDWEKIILVLNSYLPRDRKYLWEGDECQYVRFLENMYTFKYGWCSLYDLDNRIKCHTKLDLNEFLTQC